jgi:RNA polymerase sigma-70 factor (ECF subfamily)
MQACAGTLRLNTPKQLDDASERALVDRCRRNDFEAFGRFIDAYQNRVYGFVRRMVPSPDEAEDITQEVFIRAFQHFANFDGRCSVKTWLFRIANNLCIDRARRQDRIPAHTDYYPSPDEDEPIEIADFRWEPEKVALDSELLKLVEHGISTMSEKLRGVLLLHDREDMAYEDIAKALNIPVGTVKSRLFLARAHLQNVLSEYLKQEASRI